MTPVPRGNQEKSLLTAIRVTDIHLYKSREVPERFRAALREIRRRHPRAGLVLNTGDTLGCCIDTAKTLRRYRPWNSMVDSELAGTPVRSALGDRKFDEMPQTPDAGRSLRDLLQALAMRNSNTRSTRPAGDSWFLQASQNMDYGSQDSIVLIGASHRCLRQAVLHDPIVFV